MRRPSITFLLFLFAIFALLTFAAASADITDAEARLLWIVRDPERVEPASISDTARLLARNFRAMLDRAAARDLPLTVPLDLWTMLVGGSVFAARMGAVAALFAVALILRWIMRRLGFRKRLADILIVTALALISVAGALLLALGSYGPPVSGVVASYQAERRPAEPVITVFSDDSSLGYYQAQVDLRRGVGIDLGWREFTPEEIARAAASLGSGTVWLIVEDYQRYAVIDQTLTAAGRRAALCEGRYQRAAVIRYEMIGDSAGSTNAARCPES